MPIAITNRRQDYSPFVLIQRWGPVVHGSGPPADWEGHAGNIYIDDQASQLYVKRRSSDQGAWYIYLFTVPSNVVSAVKWYGVESPSVDLGADGDYFLQYLSDNFSVTPLLIGPKFGDVWPTTAEGPSEAFGWSTVNYLEGIGAETPSTLAINTTPLTYVGIGSEAVGVNLSTNSFIPVGVSTSGSLATGFVLNTQGV